DFLFIPCPEGSQVQIREQIIDLPVRQLRTFDARRCPDRLHCRNLLQSCQALGCERAERLPSTLKLIDLSDKPQHVRCKYQILEWFKGYIRNYPRNCPRLEIGCLRVSLRVWKPV